VVAGTVRKVADFLGHPLSDQAVELVVELCSPTYMKQNRHKFQLPPCVALPAELPAQIVRTGRAGDGAQLVPDNVKQVFGQQYHRVLNGTGFPVERYSGSFSAKKA